MPSCMQPQNRIGDEDLKGLVSDLFFPVGKNWAEVKLVCGGVITRVDQLHRQLGISSRCPGMVLDYDRLTMGKHH